MLVRTASEDDVEDWLALLEAVAAEGRWLGTEAPFDRVERRDAFIRSLHDPNAGVFVAVLRDRLVGALGAEASHGIVSFGMMVASDARRAGVGTALLGTCIDWARRQGAHKVTLQVWPHNLAAIRLYERAGFTVEGRLRRHYRRRNGELWDALVMGLALDDASRGHLEAAAPE